MQNLGRDQGRAQVHGLDEDDIYNEQISQLLQQAGNRLKSSLPEVGDGSTPSRGIHHTIPR